MSLSLRSLEMLTKHRNVYLAIFHRFHPLASHRCARCKQLFACLFIFTTSKKYITSAWKSESEYCASARQMWRWEGSWGFVEFLKLFWRTRKLHQQSTKTLTILRILSQKWNFKVNNLFSVSTWPVSLETVHNFFLWNLVFFDTFRYLSCVFQTIKLSPIFFDFIYEQLFQEESNHCEPSFKTPTTHLATFPSFSLLPSPPQRSTKEKNWHRKYFHSKVLMQKKFNSTLFHHQAQKCRHFTASLVKPSDEKTSRLSRKSKFMSQRFFYSRTSRRNDENKFITYGKNWVCDKSERFFKRLW
jgi:hypothetical protein